LNQYQHHHHHHATLSAPEVDTRLCAAAIELQRAVSKGKFGWTKAYEISKVASVETEKRWIEEAQSCSKHQLEEKVIHARRKAQSARKTNPRQTMIRVSATSPMPADSSRADGMLPNGDGLPVADGPVSVTVRFTPVELAQYEAICEKLRKSQRVSASSSSATLILQGLHSLLEQPGQGAESQASKSPVVPAPESAPTSDLAPVSDSKLASNKSVTLKIPKSPVLLRGHDATKYSVIVSYCEGCRSASIQTARGKKHRRAGRFWPAMAAAVKCLGVETVVFSRFTILICDSMVGATGWKT
jgi:hypothetical protein